MKRDSLFHIPDPYRPSPFRGLMLIGLFILSTLLPVTLHANVAMVQYDFPKPSPSQESSSDDPIQFDIRKPPAFVPKTPNFSLGTQRELGVFLDKERQGLGLQWDSDGKIPSVDLGLESHNLYSLNRVVPRTEPYPEWTPQSDSQYFGNPRTAPDHSGAFLRFRW